MTEPLVRGKHTRFRRNLVLFAAILLAPVLANAGIPAPPPPTQQLNPGLINNQGQQNRKQLEQQNALPPASPGVKAPPQQPEAAPEEGLSFLLRGVRVDPTPFLTKQEIDGVVQGYIGKMVNIGTLRRMVGALNAILVKKRHITVSAYLPPQQVRHGIVHIAIIEGRLGKVGVSGAKALSRSYVRSYIHLRQNDVIDLPEVENDLARFNNTGIARLQAALLPGSNFGLTDIQLSVTEPARNLFQVFVDNQGVASVGQDEVGAMYQRYGPFGIDDRLTVYGVKSSGNTFGSVSYNVPFNALGGRIGISASSGSINVVSGIYQPLAVVGHSEIISANISQPVFVHGSWMLLGDGSYAYNFSDSSQQTTSVTSDKVKLETIGFKLAYAGHDINASFAPTYSLAQWHSGVSDNGMNFGLAGGNFYIRGNLPDGYAAQAMANWQMASTALIPASVLFQVGGPTTVRGFPANAAAGPSGYFVNLELHHLLPVPDLLRNPGSTLDGFLFFDQGRSYNPFPAYQDLRSAGFGASWDISRYLAANVNVGFPLETSVYGQSSSQIYFSIVAKVF